MPVPTYIGEAWALYSATTIYEEHFKKVHFDFAILEKMKGQINALKEAEYDFRIYAVQVTEVEAQWRSDSTEAFKLRDDMFYDLRFVYRSLKKEDFPILKDLKKSNSIATLIMDLYTLSIIWSESGDGLELIRKNDQSIATRARELSETLGPLQGIARYKREHNPSRQKRIDAYYALHQSVTTIRDTAHNLFKKGSHEYQQFTSPFFRKRNRRAKKITP